MAKTNLEKQKFLNQVLEFAGNKYLTNREFLAAKQVIESNYQSISYDFSPSIKASIFAILAKKSDETVEVKEVEVQGKTISLSDKKTPIGKEIKNLSVAGADGDPGGGENSDDDSDDGAETPKSPAVKMTPGEAGNALTKSRLALQKTNLEKRVLELGSGEATKDDRLEIDKTLADINKALSDIENGVEVSDSTVRAIASAASKNMASTGMTSLGEMKEKGNDVKYLEDILNEHSSSLTKEQKEMFEKIMRNASFTTTADFTEKAGQVASQVPQRIELIGKATVGMDSKAKEGFEKMAMSASAASLSMEEFSGKIVNLSENFSEIEYLENMAKLSQIEKENAEKLVSEKALLMKEINDLTAQLSEKERNLVLEHVGDIASSSAHEVKSKFEQAIDELGLDKEGDRRQLVYSKRDGLSKRELQKFNIEAKKLEKRAKSGEITEKQFIDRLNKIRDNLDPKVFGGVTAGLFNMTKALSGSAGALENMKNSSNMFVQEIGETFESLKARRKDPLKGIAAAATEKIFTGNKVSKALFMIPGLGPVLAGGFGLISMAMGGILKLGKSLFGAITSAFKVVGQVLSTMTKVAKGVLSRTIKWGLGGLAILTLLYKTGLLEKIPKIIANLWKTVYPILARIVETALRYANETLEFLIDKVRQGIETGLIKEFPKMILSFVRGIFTSKEASSIGKEFSRFGSNLAELGTLVLEAITELWEGMKGVWTEELWPNYIEPAFEYLKENIPIWFNQLWDSIKNSQLGIAFKERIVDPIVNWIEEIKPYLIGLGLGLAGLGTVLAIPLAKFVLLGIAITSLIDWITWWTGGKKEQEEQMRHQELMARTERERAEGTRRREREIDLNKSLTAIVAENKTTNQLLEDQEVVESRLSEIDHSLHVLNSSVQSADGSNTEHLENIARLEAERQSLRTRQDALQVQLMTRVFNKEELESSEGGREFVAGLSEDRKKQLEETGNIHAESYTEQHKLLGLVRESRSEQLGASSGERRLADLARFIEDYGKESDLVASVRGKGVVATKAKQRRHVNLQGIQNILSEMSPEERGKLGFDTFEGADNRASKEFWMRSGFSEDEANEKAEGFKGAAIKKSLVGKRVDAGYASGAGEETITRTRETVIGALTALRTEMEPIREAAATRMGVESTTSGILAQGEKYIELNRQLQAAEEKSWDTDNQEEISNLKAEIERVKTAAESSLSEFKESGHFLPEDYGSILDSFETMIESLEIQASTGITGAGVSDEIVQSLNAANEAKIAFESSLQEMEERLRILGDDPEAERLREAIQALREQVENSSEVSKESTDALSNLQRSLNRNSTLLKAEREARKKEQERKEKEEFEAKGGFLGMMLDAVGASLGEEYTEATQRLKGQLGIVGVKAAAEGNVGASAAAESVAASESAAAYQSPSLEDDPNNYTESGQFDPDLAAEERRRKQDSSSPTEANLLDDPNNYTESGQFDPDLAAEERRRKQDSSRTSSDTTPIPAASAQAAQAAGESASGLAAGAAGTPGASANDMASPLEGGGSGGAGAAGMDPSLESDAAPPAAPIPAASAQAAQAAGESASGLAAGAAGTPGASASTAATPPKRRQTDYSKVDSEIREIAKLVAQGQSFPVEMLVHPDRVRKEQLIQDIQGRLYFSQRTDQLVRAGMHIMDARGQAMDEILYADKRLAAEWDGINRRNRKFDALYSIWSSSQQIVKNRDEASATTYKIGELGGQLADTSLTDEEKSAIEAEMKFHQRDLDRMNAQSDTAVKTIDDYTRIGENIPPASTTSETPASPLEGGGSGGAGAAGMDPSLESDAAPSPAAPIPAASAQAAQAAGASASGLAAGAAGTPGASASGLAAGAAGTPGASASHERRRWKVKYNEDGSMSIDITVKSASSVGGSINVARSQLSGIRRNIKNTLTGAVDLSKIEETREKATKESDGKVLIEQTLNIPSDAVGEGARERLEGANAAGNTPSSSASTAQSSAVTPVGGSGGAGAAGMDPSLESDAAPSPAAPIPAASAQAAQAAGASASGLAAGATGAPTERARMLEMQQKANNDAAQMLSRGGNAVSPEDIQGVQTIGGIPVKVKLKSGEEISLEDYHTEDEKSSVERIREMGRRMGGGASGTPSSNAVASGPTEGSTEAISLESAAPISQEAPLASASSSVRGELSRQAGDVLSTASDVAADMFMGRSDRLGITTEKDANSEPSRLMKALEGVEGEEAKELVNAIRDLTIAYKNGEIAQEEASEKLGELGEKMKENSEIMDIMNEFNNEKMNDEDIAKTLLESSERFEKPAMINTNDVFAKSNLASWYSSDKTTPALPAASSQVSESAGASASGMSDASVGTGGAGGIEAPATGGGSGGSGSAGGGAAKSDPKDETMQFLVWPKRLSMSEIVRLQKNPNHIKHALLSDYMNANGLSMANQASINEGGKWVDDNLKEATREIMSFDVDRWKQLQEYKRLQDTDPSFDQSTGVSMSSGDSSGGESSSTPPLAAASSGATASAAQSTADMASVSVGESPKRLSDDELEKFLIEGGNFENFEEKFGRPITDDDKRRIRHIRNSKSGRVINQARSQTVEMGGKEITVGELADEQEKEDASMGIMTGGDISSGEISSILGLKRATSGKLGDLRPEELQTYKNRAIDSLIRMKIKMMEMTGEFVPPQDTMEYGDAVKPIRESLGKEYAKLSPEEILQEVEKLQKEYLDATKERGEVINSVFKAVAKADDESRLAGIEQRRAEEEAEIAAEQESTSPSDIPAASEQISETVSSSVEGMTAGATGTPGESESRVPNMDDLKDFMENASQIDMQKANVRMAERGLASARTPTRGDRNDPSRRERRIEAAEQRLAEAKKILADMESGNYVAPEGPVIGPDDMDPPDPSGPKIEPLPSTASMENAAQMNTSAAEIAESSSNVTIINNTNVANANNQNNTTSNVIPNYSSRPKVSAPMIGIYSMA